MDGAFARFLETVGRACLVYADEVRSDVEPVPEHAAEFLAALRAHDPAQAPARSDPALDLPGDLNLVLSNLGPQQRKIVNVLLDAEFEGRTTAYVASQINRKTTDTHTMLRALEKRVIVESVGNQEPIHWRLAAQFRPGFADDYLSVAGHIREGEWTTSQDVAQAVDWSWDRRRRVEEQLLEAESVRFDEKGFPRREHHVHGPELRQRLQAERRSTKPLTRRRGGFD